MTLSVIRNTTASLFGEGVALYHMNRKMLLLSSKVFLSPFNFILLYSSKAQSSQNLNLPFLHVQSCLALRGEARLYENAHSLKPTLLILILISPNTFMTDILSLKHVKEW